MQTKTILNSSSLISGPTEPELWDVTLGHLLRRLAQSHGEHEAVAFTWQNRRFTYSDLAERSEIVARSMLASGLKHGDHVAIMAGNCYQYIETFFAASRIGCPFVVINNTYTPKELTAALSMTRIKALFLATSIGRRSLAPHLEVAKSMQSTRPYVKLIVTLEAQNSPDEVSEGICTYVAFCSRGKDVSSLLLEQAENNVRCEDILNLQFTSGTTGTPKAAMLTHRNLINNGRFVGLAMQLTPSDTVCCPPPLFHAFGLTMGLLASFTNSSKIVFPCDQFEPNEVLDAIHEEKCTALLGVPTMLLAEIEANQRKRYKITSVRTGLVAGSSVSAELMRQLKNEFGVEGMLIAYGMTETSPITFITALNDSEEKRLRTVGRILPHTTAKVIDRAGHIVPRGTRGEICTSGYALQKGYFENPIKTSEVMKVDEQGILWMHTGDEGVIDLEGYCSVTGRIKDIIIRGGENIFPAEIEDRLSQHSAIAEASVVAIKDAKYGEVVGAFLRPVEDALRPDLSELNQWVRKELGSHKAPQYVFWVGEEGVGQDFPKTGSGKIQKHVLRAMAEDLLDRSSMKARI